MVACNTGSQPDAHSETNIKSSLSSDRPTTPILSMHGEHFGPLSAGRAHVRALDCGANRTTQDGPPFNASSTISCGQHPQRCHVGARERMPCANSWSAWCGAGATESAARCGDLLGQFHHATCLLPFRFLFARGLFGQLHTEQPPGRKGDVHKGTHTGGRTLL